jgi:hypothetical protein
MKTQTIAELFALYQLRKSFSQINTCVLLECYFDEMDRTNIWITPRKSFFRLLESDTGSMSLEQFAVFCEENINWMECDEPDETPRTEYECEEMGILVSIFNNK